MVDGICELDSTDSIKRSEVSKKFLQKRERTVAKAETSDLERKMRLELNLERGEEVLMEYGWLFTAEVKLSDLEERFLARNLIHRIRVSLEKDLANALGLAAVDVQVINVTDRFREPPQILADLPSHLASLDSVGRREKLDQIAETLARKFSTACFPSLEWFVLDWLQVPKNALFAGALRPELAKFTSTLL